MRTHAGVPASLPSKQLTFDGVAANDQVLRNHRARPRRHQPGDRATDQRP
jgi:hypothetical protein